MHNILYDNQTLDNECITKNTKHHQLVHQQCYINTHDTYFYSFNTQHILEKIYINYVLFYLFFDLFIYLFFAQHFILFSRLTLSFSDRALSLSAFFFYHYVVCAFPSPCCPWRRRRRRRREAAVRGRVFVSLAG